MSPSPVSAAPVDGASSGSSRAVETSESVDYTFTCGTNDSFDGIKWETLKSSQGSDDEDAEGLLEEEMDSSPEDEVQGAHVVESAVQAWISDTIWPKVDACGPSLLMNFLFVLIQQFERLWLLRMPEFLSLATEPVDNFQLKWDDVATSHLMRKSRSSGIYVLSPDKDATYVGYTVDFGQRTSGHGREPVNKLVAFWRSIVPWIRWFARVAIDLGSTTPIPVMYFVEHLLIILMDATGPSNLNVNKLDTTGRRIPTFNGDPTFYEEVRSELDIVPELAPRTIAGILHGRGWRWFTASLEQFPEDGRGRGGTDMGLMAREEYKLLPVVQTTKALGKEGTSAVGRARERKRKRTSPKVETNKSAWGQKGGGGGGGGDSEMPDYAEMFRKK
ncbi:hypothetical protein MNV49_000084 [Pseudohyphozyma bogoriensis]|nr:hypothetical protein MNV49_000084 [Pseudohyphozyma bogoriensis]